MIGGIGDDEAKGLGLSGRPLVGPHHRNGHASSGCVGVKLDAHQPVVADLDLGHRADRQAGPRVDGRRRRRRGREPVEIELTDGAVAPLLGVRARHGVGHETLRRLGAPRAQP